jgi:hypothetical protein
MNESIARSRTRGSPRWREKTMMIVPVNQILHELEVGTSDKCKDCSPTE